MKEVHCSEQEAEALYNSFNPNSDGAFATGRLIDGAESAMDPQEWAEKGKIDGAPAKVYYIFSEEDASSEDASDYPWDFEHVYKIEIAEHHEDYGWDEI